MELKMLPTRLLKITPFWRNASIIVCIFFCFLPSDSLIVSKEATGLDMYRQRTWLPWQPAPWTTCDPSTKSIYIFSKVKLSSQTLGTWPKNKSPALQCWWKIQLILTSLFDKILNHEFAITYGCFFLISTLWLKYLVR